MDNKNQEEKTLSQDEFKGFIETISGFKLNSNPEMFKKQELKRYRDLRKENKKLRKTIAQLKTQIDKKSIIGFPLNFIKESIKTHHNYYIHGFNGQAVLGVTLAFPIYYEFFKLMNWDMYFIEMRRELNISFNYKIQYLHVNYLMQIEVDFNVIKYVMKNEHK